MAAPVTLATHPVVAALPDQVEPGPMAAIQATAPTAVAAAAALAEVQSVVMLRAALAAQVAMGVSAQAAVHLEAVQGLTAAAAAAAPKMALSMVELAVPEQIGILVTELAAAVAVDPLLYQQRVVTVEMRLFTAVAAAVARRQATSLVLLALVAKALSSSHTLALR